jgi:peptide/nickel transport system substrate-binding protein
VPSKTRVMASAGVAIALGLTTAACGGSNSSGGSSTTGSGSFNAATTGIVNPSTAKGGTLNLWSSQDVDSLDPAVTYYSFVWNLNRFYTRTLMTYPGAPGEAGLKLTPDLAAAQPEISADKKTYTFKLRDGLKWDDGTPLTSQDVKYGIEREFAQDVVSGGPVYLKNLLDEGQHYPGPYKDTTPGHLGLKSVQTPDDKTIVFHLQAPASNFLYLLAMPTAGPVPQKRDTGQKYALDPASSGPYMFADASAVQPGKSYTLTRNPNWSEATDPVRKALPDKVVLTITTNQDDLDSRLTAGSIDIDAAQTGVGPATRTKILTNPTLKANADAVTTGFMRFADIVSTTKPLNNIDCRKAVIYAMDPTAVQTARGGPLAAGDIAGNMLPLNIQGSDANYDPYNLRQGKPQIDKAKQELQACGQPNGFNLKIAVRNNKPTEVASATALQAALKQVNINATIDQYDGAQDTAVAGSPNNVAKKGYGLMITAWGADYPAGDGFLSAIADSRDILPSGNFNRSIIKDPSIDALFDDAAKQTDPAKSAADYSQINHKIMEGAYFLPFVFDKALNYRNPEVTNAYVENAYGMYDFQALGVEGGK